MPGLKAPTCAAPGGPSAAFAQRPCQNAGARAHTHTRGAGKSGIGHSPCKRVERNQRLAFSPDLRPGWKHPPHPSVVVVSAFVFRSIAAPARLGASYSTVPAPPLARVSARGRGSPHRRGGLGVCCKLRGLGRRREWGLRRCAAREQPEAAHRIVTRRLRDSPGTPAPASAFEEVGLSVRMERVIVTTAPPPY
jgi:hypothetical protein